jgi:hypothetical protein
MTKKSKDQEAAEEAALLAGTLPDEDRRAPEVVAGPAVAGDAPVPLSRALTDLRTPAEIASGVPLDTRTVAEIVAGVPAPVDELDRLLELVENETGYSQKQAVTDLRKLLGRPKRQPRTPRALAAESHAVSAVEIQADFDAGRITASERDRRVNALGSQPESVLIAQHIARDEQAAADAKKAAKHTGA